MLGWRLLVTLCSVLNLHILVGLCSESTLSTLHPLQNTLQCLTKGVFQTLLWSQTCFSLPFTRYRGEG